METWIYTKEQIALEVATPWGNVKDDILQYLNVFQNNRLSKHKQRRIYCGSYRLDEEHVAEKG